MRVDTYKFTCTSEEAKAEQFYLDMMRNAGVRPLKSVRATTAKVTDWYTEIDTNDEPPCQLSIQVLYSYRHKVACAITSPMLPRTVTIVQWRGYSETTNRQINEWTDSVIQELEDRGYIKEAMIVKFKAHDYFGSRNKPIKKG